MERLFKGEAYRLTGYGITPLFNAAHCTYDNLEVVKYLIYRGAEINVENNIGETPIFVATDITKSHINSINLEVVKYLVEQGADIRIKNDEGETPLFNAIRSGKLEVVEYLVENNAFVNVKNNKGKTPLDVADKEEIKNFLRDVGGKADK